MKVEKIFRERGHDRTFDQIRRKVKLLKKSYKDTRDANRKSGGRRQTCPFYQELDELLGETHSSSPVLVMENNDGEKTKTL